ncbi:MAG: hypothetical protein H0U16_06080 [Actinobacteria bacterium]|nr:hypothetical protein [Actinomycetota bacterium]
MGAQAPSQTVRVNDSAKLPEALRSVGLEEVRPTIVLTGGADALVARDLDRLRPLFTQALAPLAESVHAYVLDGGTESGIMRLMGEARAGLNARFPLIGVAAEGTVDLSRPPSPSPGSVPLEPHHTHFVLVPGDRWGDESPWIARVASVLAGEASSITVLIDGGEVSWEDVTNSVEAGRRVFVVAGSGRLADTLNDALLGHSEDERALEMARSGLLTTIHPLANPRRTADALEAFLVGEG